MKIEKLPSGSYRVRKTIDKKTYSFTYGHKPTQKEIMKSVQEALSQKSEMTENGTFEEYARKYIAIKENVLSPSTIRGYESALRCLSKRFLNLQMKNITPADVQAEINQLSATRSAKTVTNYHGFISPVLQMFRPDIQLHTTLPMKENKEVYIPTDEDVKSVLQYAKGTHWELAIMLGVYGMRRSEICAVTADDLDGNILSINKAVVQNKENKFVLKPYTKTSSSTRQIYIDDEAAALLKKQGKGFNGYPNNILQNLHRAQNALGLNKFKFHALRHYYASMAHSIGIPDQYIMAAGGWSSDGVLKSVYMHAQKDKVEDMMKFAADYLKEQVLT